MKKYDVAVIGAGASGLMTALKLKKNGKNVVVIESNAKIGKKLLATGNGRCNIINKNLEKKYFHGDTNYIDYILNTYTADKILNEFEKIGVYAFYDQEGRGYPKSLQALQVVDSLYNTNLELKTDFILNFTVKNVVKDKSGFNIKNENGDCIIANSIVIACGGSASPKHSGGNNAYNIAINLGHSITPIFPALTKFDCNNKSIKQLSGVKAKCNATLMADNKNIYSEIGEMIFSDKTLSGICLFNLSIYANKYFLQKKQVQVKFDFLNDFAVDDILNKIKMLIKNRPNMKCKEILNGFLNNKLAFSIVKESGINPDLSINFLKENQLKNLINLAKNFSLTVTQNKNWDNAQVTDGGVPLKEIDIKTMQSKICPNLYFVGEILNIHGNCGGYNLYLAWATALIAGGC